MNIPIISIMVVLILVALLWWVIGQLTVDAMILKVARVVIVVLCVLWLVNILMGGNMGGITFR
jgi:uncharacterized membrane protein YwzB